MDEVTAAYLHEEGLPYFTMFGQGISPYKDLKGDTCKHSCLSAAIAGAPSACSHVQRRSCTPGSLVAVDVVGPWLGGLASIVGWQSEEWWVCYS